MMGPQQNCWVLSRLGVKITSVPLLTDMFEKKDVKIIGFLNRCRSTWDPRQPFFNGCLVISKHFFM